MKYIYIRGDQKAITDHTTDDEVIGDSQLWKITPNRVKLVQGGDLSESNGRFFDAQVHTYRIYQASPCANDVCMLYL